MDNMKEKTIFFVGKLMQDARASGLTWDEAVAAFGVAAQATAVAASTAGDGTQEECIAHARKRLEEGFGQHVQVFFAGADLNQLRNAFSDVDANAVLENTNTRILFRH
jgi:hypothetical protein